MSLTKSSQLRKSKEEVELVNEAFAIINATNIKRNNDAIEATDKAMSEWITNCSQDAKDLIKQFADSGYKAVTKSAISRIVQANSPKPKLTEYHLRNILDSIFTAVKSEEYKDLTELRQNFRKRIASLSSAHNI